MAAFKYFTFCVFLTLLACKSTPVDPIDVVVDAPKSIEWAAFQGLKTDNFSMVSFFATPQKLLIFGDNYLTELDTAHRITRQEKFSEDFITRYDAKIHSNGVFFTYFQKNTWANVATKIAIRSVQLPQELLEIDVTKIDTNYRHIGVNSNSSPAILTLDNRLFLPVVYNVNNFNFTNSQARFLIFKLQLVANKVQATLEPTYIPLDLTVPNTRKAYSPNRLDFLKPTDKFFYFSAWVTYRMEIETGRYERIFDVYNAKFAYRNDTLWAFGAFLHDNSFAFSFLPPQQSKWSTSTTNLDSQDADWFSTDTQIVSLYNNYHLALFTSQLDSNKFEIRSLADNNISSIRDIISFNNRVYMATTQGLIFKPSKDFITFPKEK